MEKAVLFEKLKNKSVKCTACSWYCHIKSGQTGICATRYNNYGSLYSIVYGNIIGPEIDPVEKKPFYHLFPGSNFLSFGTVGCNFDCQFCQNAWMSQVNKVAGQRSKVENINKIISKYSQKITPEKIIEIALEQKVAGIAYTYNEPSIFVEFAHDVARLAKKHNLLNVYVSNGYESKETFDYISDLLDGINIDLKSFNNIFYQKICKAGIQPVLENIKRFYNSGIITEVTTLIIPDQNDSDQELNNITKFLADISHDIPWHISAFHPDYKMNNSLPTPHKTLLRAYNIGKVNKLNYIYVGNITDPEHETTLCPKCNEMLIYRNGYEVSVKSLDLQKGICKKCRSKIYGKWIT